MPNPDNSEANQGSLFESSAKNGNTLFPRTDIAGDEPGWKLHLGDGADELKETPLQRAQRLALVNARGGESERDRLKRERAAELGQRAILPIDRPQEPSVDPSIGKLATSATRAADYIEMPGPIRGEDGERVGDFTSDPEDLKTGRRESRNIGANLHDNGGEPGIPEFLNHDGTLYGSVQWRVQVLEGDRSLPRTFGEGELPPGHDLLQLPREGTTTAGVTPRDSGRSRYYGQ
jgi:hypothetical protein